MLILSGGDNFTGRDDREWKRQSDFLWKLMGEIGWDLSAVQSTDLIQGVEALKGKAAEQNIPLISANIVDEKGGQIFRASKVFEFEGKRLGVLSVVDPEHQNARNRMEETVDFSDAHKAIKKGVAELRESCDAVVLLFGGRRESALRHCDAVEGIDLIFYGMATSSQRVPAETEQGTPVYSAANRGKDFGEITLTFADDGSVKCSPFTVHELDKQIPEDDHVLGFYTQYKAEEALRRSRSREIRMAVQEMAEKEVRHSFVGVDNCTACHQEIVDDYYTTAHASAFDTLIDEFQENNPDCVACHVTGWKVPGGFGQASSDKRSMEHVQCEACHGYGTAHNRTGELVDFARANCVSCHNEEMPTDCGGAGRTFDYDDYWKQIAH